MFLKCKFIRILILVVVVCCINSLNAQELDDKLDSIPIETLLDYWKQDEYGCMHLKSGKVAEYIIEKLELKGCTIEKFREIFGREDIIYLRKSKGTIELVYYYCNICEDMRPRYYQDEKGVIVEGDICLIEFYFRDNKLFDIVYYCF